MTFLNPAILLGLLAASIPIIIHLLNLRKLKKIEFSTLIFLKELQKNKIRKIKIKQWLLLALRVLLIILIVIAFARPTLKGIAISGTASTAKTTAVFILDDTFSMSIVDSKGSYFNQAKTVINNLIGKLQEGDEAAVILLSDLSKDEVRASTNISDIKKMLDGIEIADVSGTLNAAMIKAARVFEKSYNYNKEIYLFTDLQKSRLADESNFSNLSDFFNEKVKLYLFHYGGKEVYNLSIEDFKVNTKILEKDKTINVSTIVRNHSNQSAANSVVSLFMNGVRKAQKSITLNSGESKEVVIESTILQTGFQDLYVEIEDDEILNDNLRYSNIYVPEKFDILMISEEKNDLRFIELALSAFNVGGKVKIDYKSPAQTGGIDFSRYSAVIMVGPDKITQTERLIEYVNTGGGLLVFPGNKSSLISLNSFNKNLGLPLFKSFTEMSLDKNAAVTFQQIEYEHPIFADIFVKKENRKIESPEIYSYFKIFTEGKGQSIIGLFDQSSFLAEYAMEKGKVLVFSVAPILSTSSFPLKSIFAPMIYKSILYLSAQHTEDVNYVAGNKIELPLNKFLSRQIKVITPGDNEELITIENDLYANYYPFYSAKVSGNYKFYSGEKLAEYIAVNNDIRESLPQALSISEFDNYLKSINYKGTKTVIDKDADINVVIQQARYGSELWKLFLILALLTALIEMLVARNTKKDISSLKA